MEECNIILSLAERKRIKVGNIIIFLTERGRISLHSFIISLLGREICFFLHSFPWERIIFHSFHRESIVFVGHQGRPTVGCPWYSFSCHTN